MGFGCQGSKPEDSSYNCISGNTLVNNTWNYQETGTCIGNRDCRAALPYSPDNGDDDDDKKFLIQKFLSSPIGLALIGIVSIIGIITMVTLIKKVRNRR